MLSETKDLVAVQHTAFFSCYPGEPDRSHGYVQSCYLRLFGWGIEYGSSVSILKWGGIRGLTRVRQFLLDP